MGAALSPAQSVELRAGSVRSRANRTGGLSATEQCRAVLLGPRKPWSVFPEDAVDTDFFRPSGGAEQAECAGDLRLAVVRPAQCRVQPYDHVQQVFSMQLLDRENHSLWLTVRYKQEEAGVISMLEALVRQLQLRPLSAACVFRYSLPGG